MGSTDPVTHQVSNVLVLGDDMRIFLAICRSLGRKGIGVHAGPLDADAPALTSRYITKSHVLPPYEASPEVWTRRLTEIITSNTIDLVIPCSDPFIMMLHEQRARLAGARLAIPDTPAIELLFDKDLTHQLCQRLGVAVSPARRLTPATTTGQLLKEFSLPFVLKPRRSYWLDRPGHWGRVYIIDDADMLRRALAEIADPDRYMAEAYFEGNGCGVSVLANDGEILQAFQHRRLREGLGAASSYRISEAPNPAMLEACAMIMRDMKHTGVCMFEFRINERSGKWILLETNARFWGSMALPLSLGVDFPVLLHGMLAAGKRTAGIDYRPGIRSRNITLDAFNLLKMIPRLQSGTVLPWLAGVGDFALQPLRWLARREFNDSFALDDMRPGFAEIGALVKRRR